MTWKKVVDGKGEETIPHTLLNKTRDPADTVKITPFITGDIALENPSLVVVMIVLTPPIERVIADVLVEVLQLPDD